MALKKRSECTPNEALHYLQDYFATVDLIGDALGKFELLASDAQTASNRSLYRAKALEAQRDLELLKNMRRAFLNEQAGINPPSEAAVKNAEKLAQDLAKILVQEANAKAIIDIASKGMDAFSQIHVA